MAKIIMGVFAEKAKSTAIPYRGNLFVATLLIDKDNATPVVDHETWTAGNMGDFEARTVGLTAGELEAPYRRSSSHPDVNTDDGMALAYDAGGSRAAWPF